VLDRVVGRSDSKAAHDSGKPAAADTITTAMVDGGSHQEPHAMRKRAGQVRRRGRGLVRRLRRLAAPGDGRVDGGFRKELEDGELPLSLDMASDSRTLLIALGGIGRNVSMPPFEFFKATGGIPCKRLFVRDVNQAWYQMGLPGYGTSFTSVSDTLRELVAGHDVDRLVLAGASAGGYAAMAFGTMLGADLVLCFAPQSTVDLGELHAIGDRRYDERLGEVAAAGVIDPDWIDLRAALPTHRVVNTRYHVYFADRVRPDRLHAERLVGVEGVRLYRFGRGNHNIARMMRETGALDKVLQRALGASGN
jgi:hypothetical protein